MGTELNNLQLFSTSSQLRDEIKRREENQTGPRMLLKIRYRLIRASRSANYLEFYHGCYYKIPEFYSAQFKLCNNTLRDKLKTNKKTRAAFSSNQ